MDRKSLAILAIISAVLVGGGIPPLTKLAVKEIPAFSFTFLRFFVAGICILPILLKYRLKFGKEILKVASFSLLLSLNVILFPIGVSLTTATIGQMLYIFTPILVAILSYILLSEKFDTRKVTGMFLGLIGALMIILLPQIDKASPFSGNLPGNLIIFIAVVATSFYTVLSKRFQKEYTPSQLTAIFIFTTFFVLLFLAAWDLFQHPFWWTKVSPASALGSIYVGVLGTVGYYLLTQFAIKHGSPLIASLTLYLQPVSAFVWSNQLLGEEMTKTLLAGAAVAFLGVALTLSSKK